MPFDIITIGSAVVDIFIASKDFLIKDIDKEQFFCQKIGDKIELDRFEIHSGGGGSNTAAGFAKMGFSTATVCEMGQDMWSQFVFFDLDRHNVDTSLLIKEKIEQTGGSIIMGSEDGGRTVLVNRGASSMLDPQDLPVTQLVQAKWVHLTNIGGRIETLNKLFDTMLQYEQKMSWNPGKQELQLLSDGQLDLEKLPIEVLIINEDEWQIVANIQSKLKEKIKIIVVTAGKNGGNLYSQGQQLAYDLKKIRAVEETGAGDAFGAGFISAYILGHELPTCLEWGKKNAASVVQQIGAKKGLLDRIAIE